MLWPCRSGRTPIGPMCQWARRGSWAWRWRIIVTALGRAVVQMRAIDGAVLIFCAVLSWQCGHGVAFGAPTISSARTATRARLHGRPNLATRTAARITRLALPGRRVRWPACWGCRQTPPLLSSSPTAQTTVTR